MSVDNSHSKATGESNSRATPISDMIAELQRLESEIDRTPRTVDMNERGAYHMTSYYREFDSWDDALEAAGLEPNKRGRKGIPREELLAEVQKLAESLGHTPRLKDMNEQGEYGQKAYYREFESWGDALEAVGLEPNSPGRRGTSLEELLEGLQKLAGSLGHPPRAVDMNEQGEYHATSYYSYFESWNDALEAAGLPTDPAAAPEPKYTEADILHELQRLRSQLGRAPSRRDINDYGFISAPIIYDKFDSLEAAATAAGFGDEARDPNPTGTPPEELLEELQRLADELDRTPSIADMGEHGQYSGATYYDNFGSWNAAVEAAGLEPNRGPRLSREDLLEELQRLADELGHTPRLKDMNEQGEYSKNAYYREFGSWGDAVEKID